MNVQSCEFHSPQSLLQQITGIMSDLKDIGYLKRPKQDRLTELQREYNTRSEPIPAKTTHKLNLKPWAVIK